MLYVPYDEVFRLLDPKTCVGLMRDTLLALEEGVSRQYLRTWVRLPDDDILGLMPAYLNDKVMGVKAISIFHHNTAKGLPSHQGLVLLFCSETGAPLCAVDGNAITQIRTGAVSAVATDLLARPDACKLALIGSGAQARSHLLAIREVRCLSKVSVYDSNLAFAANFASWALAEAGVHVEVAASVSAATADADIICTLTPSATPVLHLADVSAGAHINAVGASTATNRELSSDLARQARFFGDRKESVMNEAGDFLIPLGEGAYDADHFLGELGELISGKVKGRLESDDITIFESLGLAVEDLAAALYVYQQVVG